MLMFANQYEGIIWPALGLFVGIAIVCAVVALAVGGTAALAIKKTTNLSWITSCLVVLLMPLLYNVLWRQPKADVVEELVKIESPSDHLPIFAAGAKTQLRLMVKLKDGRTSEYRNPQWRSSNKYLNVEPDGTMEAIAPGKGAITAQAEGMEISREFLVSPLTLDSMDLESPMPSRPLGDTRQSLVGLNWSDGSRTQLGFSHFGCQSSNPDVADFVEGQLLSKTVGQTTLTVSYLGRSHRWEFEVTPGLGTSAP